MLMLSPNNTKPKTALTKRLEQLELVTVPLIVTKYNRTGIRACDVPSLEPFLVDIYEELSWQILLFLMEGAQGFWLDPDWGDYPICHFLTHWCGCCHSKWYQSAFYS